VGVTIIDNFLPIDEFEILQKTIISLDFPLYFCNHVAGKDEILSIDDVNFIHLIYKDNTPNSSYYDIINQILFSKLEMRSLIRSKVNCYPRTDKIIEHSWHRDFSYEHSGILFYLNTCNGKTKFEKDTVESKENRIVFFDPSKLHASTSCTDQKCRWNIIANYF
tara:strand:+ start:60 stop:551 length:492 start_codon:yes stop_codon:yes gene_type:complete